MRNAGCVLRFKCKRKIANAKIYEDKRDLYCMSNLQVLGQSLNRMSSEVLRLAFGQEGFPSIEVQAISSSPRVHCAAHYMAAMGLWRPPGGPGATGPVSVSSCNDCMKCKDCVLNLDA